MTENVNEGIADLHLNEEGQIMVIDAPERSFTETMRVTSERLDQLQKEMQTTLVQAANIEQRIDNADPTYDLTADHECLEGLEKRMKILQIKIERCQKRLDMLVSSFKDDSEPSSIDTNSARMAMHTSKPSKVTLDDTIPRFGSVHLGKGQKF